MRGVERRTRPAAGNGYPTSDGKPMAETDFHRDLMVELIGTLKAHFADRPEVYVSGNLLVFYAEGDKHRHVSPDVFVVRGVGQRDRLNYLIWEEGRPPEFVVELTSSSTRREDTGHKRELYQELRVREYFLFDPFGDWLDPRLQGFRLERGVFVGVPSRGGRLRSRVLGLDLVQRGERVRLLDPAAGLLATPAEAQEAERQRAETERRRADAEQLRAEAECQRADAAEAEIARLRAELDRLCGG